jgi:lipoprotein-releasing system permease protein
VFVISVFSVLVLSVANFSFLTILSVFSGLENYSVSFSKSFDPDIKIKSLRGNTLYADDNDLELISKTPGVVSVSKTILGKAVVQNDGKTEFAEIIGVDNGFESVILIDSIMQVGQFSKLDIYSSYTSSAISERLNLTLYNMSGEFTVSTISSDYLNFFLQPFGNSQALISNGVFKTRDNENENKIIVSLPFASGLFSYEKNTYSELLLKTSENPNAIKAKLKKLFPDFSILTHKEQNETLYKIMQSEKLIITVIMFFIVLISAFNVVAAVSMLIIEKEDNIKTLRALGMNKKDLFQLFFKHGMLINFSGLIIGLIASLALIFLQINYSVVSIPGLDVPYPVLLKTENIGILIICAIVVSVFSSYLGALASKKIS